MRSESRALLTAFACASVPAGGGPGRDGRGSARPVSRRRILLWVHDLEPAARLDTRDLHEPLAAGTLKLVHDHGHTTRGPAFPPDAGRSGCDATPFLMASHSRGSLNCARSLVIKAWNPAFLASGRTLRSFLPFQDNSETCATSWPSSTWRSGSMICTAVSSSMRRRITRPGALDRSCQHNGQSRAHRWQHPRRPQGSTRRSDRPGRRRASGRLPRRRAPWSR